MLETMETALQFFKLLTKILFYFDLVVVEVAFVAALLISSGATISIKTGRK